MPVNEDILECAKCGKKSLLRNTWLSTSEFNEECCNCGYFREATRGYNLEEEDLTEMNFELKGIYFFREGVIKKNKNGYGKYEVAGGWFSSPMDMSEIVIDWINEDISGNNTAEQKVDWKKIREENINKAKKTKKREK